MSSEGERLGRYVLARRKLLDLNQLEVWANGGPSNTTLSTIENGLLETLTRTTARKLDKGLEWEPGSARVVWEGGEPTPRQRGTVADEIRASNMSRQGKEVALRALETYFRDAGDTGGDMGERGDLPA